MPYARDAHREHGEPVVTAPHHLFVCTSCRASGDVKEPRDGRPGARFFANLTARYASWARREGFVIAPYECLSVCSRSCGVALRAPGKFTYVFGDLKPGETEGALIECATLYRHAKVGFLPRDERPLPLRAGILARIPPLEPL